MYLIGGGGLIFSPNRPPFLCHRPDLGRLPASLHPMVPKSVEAWSRFDTRPGKPNEHSEQYFNDERLLRRHFAHRQGYPQNEVLPST